MGGGIQARSQPVSAPVISNSSPLIALEQIGHLHLLESLFGEVWVPSAVVNEGAMTVSLPPSIQLRPISNALAATVLKTTLGAGESEAITLDDRPARRMAESLGLTVMGTLGILSSAKKRGMISAVKPLIAALDQVHFHVAPELAHRVILDAGKQL